MCRAVPQIWIRVEILRIQGSRKWEKSISGWPLGFRVLRVSPLNRNVPIPIKMRGLSTLYDARFLRYRNTVFFGIFWNSEINMKCNSFWPEIGGSVQVGVFFMMFPYPSSFIPKRPPSHLGGPQSRRGQFLTLGILFELINYSWNFNLGTSENFFLIGMRRYSKMWLPYQNLPKLVKYLWI